MKDIFSNWRSWTTTIKEEERPSGFRQLLTKQPIEDHPKLGPLPPADGDITEDHYVEAIVAVAKCIKNKEARERYLDAAYGRIPVYDSDHPYHPRIGHKEVSPGFKNFLKRKIKESVKYTYYVSGFFSPCDVARIIDIRFKEEKEEYEKKESDVAFKHGFSDRKPTNKEFSELGLVRFKGNSAVLTKGNDFRENRTWGWPTMIRFLDSFEKNPNVKRWGPWYVEDISKQEGGDISEHGSHQWGLDVDMSIPTTTLRDAPEGFETEKKSYQNISQGTSKRDIKSGHWGFKDVQPEELNIDACIDFLEHCFGGQFQKGWKIKNIWVDDVLITAIKNEIERRSKEGKLPKEYLALFGKQRKHRKWPDTKKWMGGPVSHWPNHQNHFHVRLVGVDPEIRKAIRKGGTGAQRQSYLGYSKAWEKIAADIEKAHLDQIAKKAADEEVMDQL